ncbi:MAG: hypothetical protein LBM67_09160 [Lentimicrobiaceae bacterium]|jgi:hypothetical protein|nr:hypothetical protein [Lentimicrobiaceae bacterium]
MGNEGEEKKDNATQESPCNGATPKKDPAQEQAQEQKLKEVQAHYVVGGIDEEGHKITDIYVKTPDYVIYEVETDKLSQSLRINIYEILEKKEEEKYKRLRTNLRKVYDEIAKVREALYKSSDPSAVKAQAASYISLALDYDNSEYEEKKKECKNRSKKNPKRDCKNCPKHSDCAEYELNKLIDYIDKRYKEQFRQKFKHLSIIGGVSFLLISLSFITHYHFFCGFFDSIKDFIYVATAGSIGGFISVSIGIKKINFFQNDDAKDEKSEDKPKNNPENEKGKEPSEKGILTPTIDPNAEDKKSKNDKVSSIYFILYGLERAFVSIFSAIIIYIVLESGILNLIDVKNIWGFIVFGFVAGFSEIFIPNILRSVEKTGTQGYK